MFTGTIAVQVASAADLHSVLCAQHDTCLLLRQPYDRIHSTLEVHHI